MGVTAAYWLWTSGQSDSEKSSPIARNSTTSKSKVVTVESEAQPLGVQATPADVHEIPDIQEVDVKFPSGETVRVSLINFVPDNPPFPPSSRVVDMHDQLVASAESGNGASARVLYGSLKGCKNAFADKKSMLDAVSHLRSTGEVIHPNDDSRHGRIPAGLDTSEMEELIRKNYETCEGITVEQKDDAEYWLEVAAGANDFLALREYARYLGSGTRESFELIQNTWDMGFVSAANSLAIYYEKGGAGVGGQVDYVNSYAYSLIGSQVYQAALLRDGSRQSRYGTQSHNKIKSLDDMLAAKAGYLTPDQQAEAEQVAIDVLKKNESCCRGSWSSF